MIQSSYMASADDVRKLAALARVAIPDEKLESFAAELDSILKYVGMLENMDIATDGKAVGAVQNVFRTDGEPHETGRYTEKLVEQFPDHEGNALRVKQIISHD